MGAILMTYECGIRFLTDYLEGDHYFKISREGQNLDRCRTQFCLVKDMEEKAAPDAKHRGAVQKNRLKVKASIQKASGAFRDTLQEGMRYRRTALLPSSL